VERTVVNVRMIAVLVAMAIASSGLGAAWMYVTWRTEAPFMALGSGAWCAVVGLAFAGVFSWIGRRMHGRMLSSPRMTGGALAALFTIAAGFGMVAMIKMLPPFWWEVR
jgi:hypothetical protein